MSLIFTAALFLLPAPHADAGGQEQCKDIPESSIVRSMDALPAEIGKDLKSRLRSVAEPGEALRTGDVVTEESRKAAEFRFTFAVRRQNEWFTVIEHGYPHAFLLIGYVSLEGQPYQRSPMRFLAGPPCVVAKAALDGVVSPGGFGPDF